MRVAADVYQIPSMWGSNAYLLDGEQDAVIDAGGPGADRPSMEYVRALGRQPADVGQILLTHGHPDHYGGASRLRETTGALVLAHSGDVSVDRHGTQRARYPWLPNIGCPPVDGYLEEGQLLPILGGLRVYHTPGHTPGSVCFHLEGRDLLFTGDTLLSNGRSFRPPLFFPGTSWSRYRSSVHRLGEMEFQTAATGHGRPCTPEASARLKEFLKVHYQSGGPVWWRLARKVPLLSRIGALRLLDRQDTSTTPGQGAPER